MTVPVAVIGAGPAGLAAAVRLKQRGFQVRVLEASDRVGCKLASSERDGFLIDEGAYFLPTTHRALLALAEETGFGDQVVPGGFVLATARNGDVHHIRGDRVLRDVALTPLLSGRAKARLGKLGGDLLRARRATYDRIAETAPYDTETVEQWAGRGLGDELREYLIRSTMRAIFAAEADQLSRVDFLGVIALFGGARLVAFREGMGSFADHLAGSLDVELNADVIAVEERRDLVRVTWASPGGSEQRDFGGCVLAAPAPDAARIHTGLDRWRSEFMGRVRKGKLLIANVGLSEPPPGPPATYLQIPPSVHPFLAGIAFDHHKAPGRAPAGKALLTLTGTNAWSERRFDDDDDGIVGAFTAALEAVLPGTSSKVEFAVLQRWTQQYNPLGHYRDLGRFRQISETSDRRVQLAGEYHSTPNLEAATRSGESAAARLAAALGVA